MPTVSVILTSFNHRSHVRQAIDSVLNQTMTDFELIILDDASSDGSWDLIEAYRDPRICAFRSPHQGQVVHLTNHAISTYAKGEYIAIHHSDDLWAPTKLEHQVEILRGRPEIGAVFTWARIIDEHGVDSLNEWFHLKTSDRWEILNKLFHGINGLSHPSAMVRRKCYEATGVYRHGLLQTDDAEMWSRLLLKFPIHVIDAPLTIHRRFSNQSNISGVRTDVAVRSSTEWGYVRENFLEASSFEDVVAIFPNLNRFRDSRGYDVKFLMAMACLHECDDRSAWSLGLKWLFELFNDSVRRQKIRDLYAFSEFDFFELSGRFDAYFVNGEKQDQKQIERLSLEFEEMRTECGQLSARIQSDKAAQEKYEHALADAQKLLAIYVGDLAQRDAELVQHTLVMAQLELALARHKKVLAQRDEAIAALMLNLKGVEADTVQLSLQRDALVDQLSDRERSIVNRDRSNAALLSQLRELTVRVRKSEADLQEAGNRPLAHLVNFLR
jgi:glycosyltransferase involved in cell wall biosynthesis